MNAVSKNGKQTLLIGWRMVVLNTYGPAITGNNLNTNIYRRKTVVNNKQCRRTNLLSYAATDDVLLGRSNSIL